MSCGKGAAISTSDGEEESPLVISMLADSHIHRAISNVLTEAYRRVDVPVTFRISPGYRPLVDANNGMVDGDVARIEGTEKEYQNLLPVPVSLVSMRARPYTISSRVNVRHWDDLSGLNVGVIRGARYAQLKNYPFHIVRFQKAEKMFENLIRDRLHIVVLNETSAQAIIKRHYPTQGILEAGEVLHESGMFHFLHKQHSAIIPRLSKALASMKKSGELERLYKECYMQNYDRV